MKINLGCGYDRRPGYFNVDVDPACKPDFLISSIEDLPKLGSNFVDEILAKDVLEHMPRVQTPTALLEMAALLKTGGVLDLQTTSLVHLLRLLEADPAFEAQYNWGTCLFGNQQHAGDFHFNGFTESILRGHLYGAGFSVDEPVEIVESWMMRVRATKTRCWTKILAETSDPERRTRLAYARYLQREPSEPDLAQWISNFSNMDPRLVLRAIVSSPEAMYRAGRAADQLSPMSRG